MPHSSPGRNGSGCHHRGRRDPSHFHNKLAKELQAADALRREMLKAIAEQLRSADHRHHPHQDGGGVP